MRCEKGISATQPSRFGASSRSRCWARPGRHAAGDVFDAVEGEEARIGWDQMRLAGRIRAIRKSDEGRLLAVVSRSDANIW